MSAQLKKLAAFALTVVAIMALSVAVSWRLAPREPAALPACTTEDDVRDCYWDANKRGNHEGASFIHWQNNYYLLDV